ncbi:hypothetical protein [Marinomonas balearica]|uniref:hypothetical protein n=1 Tax=Marinomonas balearica TaxID=491947 RepID=UPI001AAC9903|nr:hypothetical protein [Marinomonas balearica]
MEIYVYADWTDLTDPILVGTLRSSEIRGKEHFSFSYDEKWLASDYVRQIDPSLNLVEYSSMRLTEQEKPAVRALHKVTL